MHAATAIVVLDVVQAADPHAVNASARPSYGENEVAAWRTLREVRNLRPTQARHCVAVDG